MKYKPAQDGEEICPKMDGYKMACCDCGLVHKMKFRAIRITKRNSDGTYNYVVLPKEKYQVELSAVRDNRATAAKRRKKK